MEDSKFDFKRVADNLFIRLSTGRYYMIAKRNDRQFRKSLKTKVRSIANAKLSNELARIGISRTNPKAKHVPYFGAVYMEAVNVARAERLRPRSVETIEGHLKIASQSFLGTMRVSDIQTEHLLKYLRDRSTETSGHTANQDLGALRRFFNLAIERHWTNSNPAKHIEPFAHRAKKLHIPEADHIQTVLKYLRSSFNHPEVIADRRKAADFIEFLTLSGTRIEGAQTISWSDVRFDKDFMSVTEKGSKTRIVPLFPQLKEFLQRIYKPTGLIFPKDQSKKSAQNYYPKKALNAAIEKTGVPKFTFHALRHFFATEALERGIQPSVIAGWFGHSDNGILIMKTYANHIRAKHFANEAMRVQIDLSPSVASVASSIDQYLIG